MKTIILDGYDIAKETLEKQWQNDCLIVSFTARLTSSIFQQ